MDELEQITSQDLESFPCLSQYKADLSKLGKLNLSQLNFEQRLDKIYDLARTIPGSIGWMEPEQFNYHSFFRVRKNINRFDEDITLAQTYSYPPPKACFNNGRANLKGKSVFYCSNEADAAIRECKPEKDDEIYLSVWKGIAKNRIKVGNLLPPDLNAQNIWSNMAKEVFEQTINSLPSRVGDKSNHILALYRFIAEKFRSEQKPYYLTSMISWEYLYGQMWRDFIIYPSFLSNERFCNMAFHPNSVNQNLKFDKLIKLKVTGHNSDGPIFRIGSTVGYIEKTKMLWREKTEQEINLFKKIR
nr:RES domain-containing protein [uncultured Allomuricauda sp.]